MEKIMQMKIVRGVAPTVLLLYLFIREFFFFTSKFSSAVSGQHDQHQISFVSQIFVSVKPSNIVVFFTFNIIVVALLLGVSAQLSSFSSSSSSTELSILSYIDSYEGLNSTKDEDYYEPYNDDFIPRIVYVEYKEEKGEDEHQSYDDCYKEEEIITTADDDDRDDDQEEQKAEVLMSYGYFRCDHEDNMSEEDKYSELNDDDFNKKIEEFIGENNKKWREELQNEKLIYVDRIIS